MKKLFLALLLWLPLQAYAETAGPGCEFAWDYADPLPANVDGFRFYLDGNQAWEGTAKQVTCTDVGVAIEGSYSAYVVAYNDAAESGPSNTLTFTYVTGGPSDAPTILRFIN